MNEKELLNKAIDNLEKDKNCSNVKEILTTLTQSKSKNIKKQAYKYLGRYYDLIEKDYSTSIKYYKKILDFDLTDREKTEVNYTIGLLITLSTDYLDFKNDIAKIEDLERQAISYFKKALNIDYQEYFIESSLQLAICYFTLDQFNQAISVLDGLDNYNLPEEKKREVYDIIGASYYALQKYDIAKKYFEKISYKIIDKSLIESQFLLGHIYYFEGKVLDALQAEIETIYYESKYPEFETDYKEAAFSTVDDILKNVLYFKYRMEVINIIESNIEPSKDLYLIFKKVGDVFLRNKLIWRGLKCYKIALRAFLRKN